MTQPQLAAAVVAPAAHGSSGEKGAAVRPPDRYVDRSSSEGNDSTARGWLIVSDGAAHLGPIAESPVTSEM